MPEKVIAVNDLTRAARKPEIIEVGHAGAGGAETLAQRCAGFGVWITLANRFVELPLRIAPDLLAKSDPRDGSCGGVRLAMRRRWNRRNVGKFSIADQIAQPGRA